MSARCPHWKITIFPFVISMYLGGSYFETVQTSRFSSCLCSLILASIRVLVCNHYYYCFLFLAFNIKNLNSTVDKSFSLYLFIQIIIYISRRSLFSSMECELIPSLFVSLLRLSHLGHGEHLYVDSYVLLACPHHHFFS